MKFTKLDIQMCQKAKELQEQWKPPMASTGVGMMSTSDTTRVRVVKREMLIGRGLCL